MALITVLVYNPQQVALTPSYKRNTQVERLSGGKPVTFDPGPEGSLGRRKKRRMVFGPSAVIH